MRKVWILFAVSISIFYSCGQSNDGKKLAIRSCSSCHAFPKAELLDKNTWKEHVLPRMGAWLGVGDKTLLMRDMAGNENYGNNETINLIPDKPLIQEEDWRKIQDYYLDNSPEYLVAENQIEDYKPLSEKFEIERYESKIAYSLPSYTMLSFEESTRQFYAGNRNGYIDVYDPQFKWVESIDFGLTASSLLVSSKDRMEALLMGHLRPNNESDGTLKLFSRGEAKKILINGLLRPVYIEKADLNQDGNIDYLISSFGNHIGKLAWYELKNDLFIEHVLLPIPGAIKTIIEDVNKDGLPDIIALMTQGDESVFYFQNLGKNQFRPMQWLQLPPVYGSSDFVYEDFDKDGFKDLLIVCGDNADFSLINKPYHGLYFYSNDGRNHFIEKKFIPISGASGLEIADFDSDGDNDLALIAHFADFSKKPNRSFVFFENLGDFKYQAYLSEETDIGRWLVFDQGDFDEDGDIDLVLGSHLSKAMIDQTTWQEWLDRKANFLVLRNTNK